MSAHPFVFCYPYTCGKFFEGGQCISLAASFLGYTCQQISSSFCRSQFARSYLLPSFFRYKQFLQLATADLGPTPVYSYGGRSYLVPWNSVRHCTTDLRIGTGVALVEFIAYGYVLRLRSWRVPTMALKKHSTFLLLVPLGFVPFNVFLSSSVGRTPPRATHTGIFHTAILNPSPAILSDSLLTVSALFARMRDRALGTALLLITPYNFTILIRSFALSMGSERSTRCRSFVTLSRLGRPYVVQYPSGQL